MNFFFLEIKVKKRLFDNIFEMKLTSFLTLILFNLIRFYFLFCLRIAMTYLASWKQYFFCSK